jgi:hypothetical protein
MQVFNRELMYEKGFFWFLQDVNHQAKHLPRLFMTTDSIMQM